MAEEVTCPECGGPVAPDSQFPGAFQCPFCKTGLFLYRVRPGKVFDPADLSKYRAEKQLIDDEELAHKADRMADEIQAAYYRAH